ncbi:Hypothetical protein SRAE_1000303900 [Strongyloides ratti]|uniref:Uncharacterized protein n=1 Tax=Strongyloides ratti TaxID=34506 RepID=A0A090L4R7_STRRB|nr:Hypothetical protein SRAE_1000303900 [Strongyloides ratti]CEF64786.1 Hypothetical protein SRAE_1000303900 [Strongyloides ratti]
MVEGSQMNRDYNCQEGDNHRLIVYKNEEIMQNINETKYFQINTANFNGPKYNAILNFGSNSIFNLQNILYIEVPLEKLYLPNSESNTPYNYISSKGIRFLYCPIDNLANHMYHFTNYNGNKFLRKYHGSNRCNVGHCEIGLTLYRKDHDANKLLHGGLINYSFYISIKAKPDMALLFSGVEMNNNVYPLVPCPYIGWIANHVNASFVPSDYVLDSYIKIDEDYNRHRLMPAYKHTSYYSGIPGSKTNAFICGYIKQKDQPDLPVGFELHNKNQQIEPVEIKMDEKKIMCNGIDISEHYKFGYLEASYNLIANKLQFDYLDKDIKFYHGQILYVYDREIIEHERKEALRNKNILENDSLFDSKYFDDKIHYYNPICYGRIKDRSAVLKPKVGNVPQKESGEMTFKVANQGANIGNKLSCHAVIDGLPDERFSDFYLKRYKTKIQRIKNPKGEKVDEKKVDSLPIIEDVDKFFGTYKCELEEDGGFDLILQKEFTIIPEKSVHYKNTVRGSSSDKDILKCNLKSIDNLKLYEMKVNDGIDKIKIFNYYKKDEFNENFILRNEYITYHPSKPDDYKNNTIVSCTFGIPGDSNSLYETTYHISKASTGLKEDDEASKNNKLYILIGCSAGGVLLLIIIVIIIVILIKKKKASQTTTAPKLTTKITLPPNRNKHSSSRGKDKKKSSSVSVSVSSKSLNKNSKSRTKSKVSSSR